MNFIFFLIIILFAAVIHEYSHGWAADRLGDPTAKNFGRLTLNPLAHIDWWGSLLLPLLLYFGTGGNFLFGYAKPVPFNPNNLRWRKWGPAAVAFAGPAANLLLAFLFSLFLFLFSRTAGFSSRLIFSGCLISIIQINLILAVFNLLPLPPLDGSKIIAAFLPAGWEERFLALERHEMIFIVLLIFLVFPYIYPVIDFLLKWLVGFALP